MDRLVLIDSNLLLLLVVGSTDRRYIGVHKGLKAYEPRHFDLLVQAITLFSDIVVLPHVLTEVSSLSRQIKEPLRRQIQLTFAKFTDSAREIYATSSRAMQREEFLVLGLTDCTILDLLDLSGPDAAFVLLTADRRLAAQADSLGHEVLDFTELAELT